MTEVAEIFRALRLASVELEPGTAIEAQCGERGYETATKMYEVDERSVVIIAAEVSHDNALRKGHDMPSERSQLGFGAIGESMFEKLVGTIYGPVCDRRVVVIEMRVLAWQSE